MQIYDAISILLAAERDPSIRSTPAYDAARSRVSSEEDAQEWFELERSFYAVNEGLLSSVSMRSESRERIRMAVANGSPSSLDLSAPTQPPPLDHALPIQFPRRSLYWIGAAAAAMLFGVLLFPALIKTDGSRIAASSFADFGSQYLDGPVVVERTKTVEESLDYLSQNEAPCCRKTFESALDNKTVGCQILRWNDRKVSLICIKTATHEIVHFMTMDLDTLEQSEIGPNTGSLQVVNKRETKTWIKGDKVFLGLAHKRKQKLDLPDNLVRL